MHVLGRYVAAPLSLHYASGILEVRKACKPFDHVHYLLLDRLGHRCARYCRLLVVVDWYRLMSSRLISARALKCLKNP